MAAENARWTSKQKCENLHRYCSRDTRELVRKIGPRLENKWNATVSELYELYQGEEKKERYSRESLDRFVRRDHVVTKRKHLVKYYREFNRRLNGLRDKLQDSERDRLFWIGIPTELQQDAYLELRTKRRSFDRHKAPDMFEVYKLILAIMDKESLYANLTSSWKVGKPRHDKNSSNARKHSKKYSTSELDSDTDSSEEDNPKRRRKTKKHISFSDYHSSDSSPDDSSDSESSDNEQPKHSSKKKKVNQTDGKRISKQNANASTAIHSPKKTQ